MVQAIEPGGPTRLLLLAGKLRQLDAYVERCWFRGLQRKAQNTAVSNCGRLTYSND